MFSMKMRHKELKVICFTVRGKIIAALSAHMYIWDVNLKISETVFMHFLG